MEKRNKGRKPKDLTNKRFGSLVAVELTGETKDGFRLWRCMCDCGHEQSLTSGYLGQRTSKGCIRCGSRTRRRSGSLEETSFEGVEDHPLRNTYAGMKSRCYNDNHLSYARYGGRGIKVCDRWLGRDGFRNFLEDMGPRPQGYTLDRRDNELGYSPENCRWATLNQQQRNTNKTLFIIDDGKRVAVRDYVESKGIDMGLVYARLVDGWSLEDATEQTHRTKIKHRTNTDYVGVSLRKPGSETPYHAQAILADSEGFRAKRSLGWFATAIDAAIARDTAVLADGRPVLDLNFPIKVLVELSERAYCIAKDRGLI